MVSCQKSYNFMSVKYSLNAMRSDNILDQAQILFKIGNLKLRSASFDPVKSQNWIVQKKILCIRKERISRKVISKNAKVTPILNVWKGNFEAWWTSPFLSILNLSSQNQTSWRGFLVLCRNWSRTDRKVFQNSFSKPSTYEAEFCNICCGESNIYQFRSRVTGL